MIFFNKKERYTKKLFYLIENYRDEEALALLDKHKKYITTEFVNNRGENLFECAIKRDTYSNECSSELVLKLLKLDSAKLNFSESLYYAINFMDAEPLVTYIVANLTLSPHAEHMEIIKKSLFNCHNTNYISIISQNHLLTSFYEEGGQNLLTSLAVQFRDNPERLIFHIHKEDRHSSSKRAIPLPFIELINFYIDNGIQPDQRDLNGSTALDIILTRYLKPKDPHWKLFHNLYGSKKATLDIITLLLYRGATLSIKKPEQYCKEDIECLNILRNQIENEILKTTITAQPKKFSNRI